MFRHSWGKIQKTFDEGHLGHKSQTVTVKIGPTVDFIHDSWRYIENAQCKLQKCTIQTKRRDKTKDRRLTENWNNQSDIILFNLCGCVFHYIQMKQKNWAMLYNIDWLFALKLRELFC